MELPNIVKVRRKFEDNSIHDIEGHVRMQLDKARISELVKPGQKIALTLGSRGVANIARVIKTVGEVVRECKAEPFIVLGMGSHGGGTVEGQLKIAATLGVTEATMGMPIQATMDVVHLGTTDTGVPVHMDKNAFESDGIIVIHRVKYHRHMMGPHQSGLLKMLTIGLGKKRGAATVHSFGWDNFPERVVKVASLALEKAPILLGLGLVENAFAKTAFIEPVKPENFVQQNAVLLQKALDMIPRIPFEKIDLLVVGEMGKTILPDTDILGRPSLRSYTEIVDPNPSRIVCLDLQDASLGNAVGVGSFDYITRRFFNKIDFRVTAVNAIAGNVPETGKIPAPLDTDRLAIEAGLQNAGFPDVEGVRDINDARVVFMKNTAEMQVIYISECLAGKIKDSRRNEVVGEPFLIPFDAEGNLALDFKA
jgi:hypothetical protein